MTTTLLPGPTRNPREAGNDPKLGAAAQRVPAASKVDYRPQAILELHRPSSLDYRVRHKLPVEKRLAKNCDLFRTSLIIPSFEFKLETFDLEIRAFEVL